MTGPTSGPSTHPKGSSAESAGRQRSTSSPHPDIPGFTFVDHLGEGGMGVVYKAVDDASNDLIALKTVRGIDEKELSAIRREIHALSGLDHPGIVQIRRHGVERGRPWYAMELLDGETYESLLRECWGSFAAPLGSESSIATASTPVAALNSDRLRSSDEAEGSRPRALDGASLREDRPAAGAGDLGRVLRPLAELCVALSYLHGRGIVHRDLKPANLFLSGKSGSVVGDFGVAYRSHRGMGREVLGVTERAGTVAYVSPEQVRGGGLDARSDLYSLGCMIYRAVAGRVPFLGDQSTVCKSHLSERPRGPSDLAWGVPDELEAVILGLLEKEPRDRPGYARDVANELWLHVPGGAPRDLDYGESYLYRPQLTGRAELVATLLKAVRAAFDGDERVFLVSGPSGIGKTAFLGEVARRLGGDAIEIVAEPSFADLPVDASSSSAAALEPLKPLLRVIADHCALTGPAETKRIFGDRGGLLSEFEPLIAELVSDGVAASADVDPQIPAEGRQWLQFEALSSALDAYARDRRLLVVLDDLQWSDEVTLELLKALSENRYGAGGCVVLASARSEETSEPLMELRAAANVAHYELGPLEESSVLSLIREMLAIDDAPRELAVAITDRSDGSPYFVIEYLGALLQSGALGRTRGGSWRWLDEEAGTGISQPEPTSLRGLVDQRLQLVSAEAAPLLSTAAALGREIDGELLEATFGEAEDMFLSAISELVDLSILEEADGGRLRFVHDQLRTAAYDNIDSARRRDLHRTVAETLERRLEDGAPPEDTVLGDHWFAAGSVEEATTYWERAGHAAMEQFASRKAISLFEALLEHAPPDTERLRKAHWRLELARAYMSRGRHDECIESASAALEELGLPLPSSRSGWLRQSTADVVRQLMRRWGFVVVRSIDEAKDRERFSEADRCLRLAAQSYYWRNQLLPTLGATFRSLNIAERLGPSVDLRRSYAMAAGIAQMFRLPGLTERYLALATASTNAEDDPVGHAEVLNMIGIVRGGMGHWTAAREHLEESEQLLRKLGYHVWWEVTAMSLATIEDFVGHTSQALARYAEAYESSLRGNSQTQRWALFGALRCHLLEGNLDRGAECIELLTGLSDEDATDGAAAAWRAYLQMLRKDWAGAAKLLSSIPKGWDVSQATYSAYTFLSASLEVCLAVIREGAAPDRAEAGARITRQVALLDRYSKTFPIGRAAALRGQGHLAHQRGKTRKAIALWGQSLELARQLGQPAEEARARIDLASSSLVSLAERRDHAQGAIEILSRLGFRPERARALEVHAGLLHDRSEAATHAGDRK